MAILINQGLPLARRGGEEFKYAEYGLPVLELTGDTSAMTKENPVTLAYKYKDMAGTCEVKWQGSSSLSYPKKNYTIKFDQEFEAKEGWGAQKKYCLKANFIDHSHARNVVSAKLWGDIVRSRKDNGVYDTLSLDRVTHFARDNGKTPEHRASIQDGVVTIWTDIVNSGPVCWMGNKLRAGTHTITFDVYNPYDAESDPNGMVSCSVCGYYDNSDCSKRVCSWECYTQIINDCPTAYTPTRQMWHTQQVTLYFPEDAEFSIMPFSCDPLHNGSGSTEGYKFRNILIDGKAPEEEPIERLKALPNCGAIDGFPAIVTMNGEFHGLYTFNIPKDGWMFGMGEGANEAIVCAETHCDATRFKATALVDGSDFDLEYALDKGNAEWVAESLNRAISACLNSDGSDLDTEVNKYLDIDSAIDYYIFVSLVCGGDMTDKNYLLVTYDGVRWFFSAYDMDSTYGLNWQGNAFNWSGTVAVPNIANYMTALKLVVDHKKDALKERYADIRNTVMSEYNMMKEFYNFAAGIPKAVLKEDCMKWPTIPSTSVNGIESILQWYRYYVEKLDQGIENL